MSWKASSTEGWRCVESMTTHRRCTSCPALQSTQRKRPERQASCLRAERPGQMSSLHSTAPTSGKTTDQTTVAQGFYVLKINPVLIITASSPAASQSWWTEVTYQGRRSDRRPGWRDRLVFQIICTSVWFKVYSTDLALRHCSIVRLMAETSLKSTSAWGWLDNCWVNSPFRGNWHHTATLTFVSIAAYSDRLKWTVTMRLCRLKMKWRWSG